MLYVGSIQAAPIVPFSNGKPISAQPFPFTWSPHLTDPKDNAVGPVPNSTASISASPTVYGAGCDPVTDCAGLPDGTYFTARFVGDVIEVGGILYKVLNENLAISVKINTATSGQGSGLRQIPFENYNNDVKLPNAKPPYSFVSGNKAEVSLYIIKPFLREVAINGTTVANIYASSTSDGFDFGRPLAIISLSGRVTVDQSCDFTAGTVLPPINFGDLSAVDSGWRVPGRGPDGKEKTINLNIQCVNLPDAKFKLSLQGEPSSDPRFLKTGNPDVGIKFTDADGAEIRPVPKPGTEFPANPIPFDYSIPLRPTGSTFIKVSPVSTTTNEPKKGAYTATATIGVELK